MFVRTTHIQFLSILYTWSSQYFSTKRGSWVCVLGNVLVCVYQQRAVLYTVVLNDIGRIYKLFGKIHIDLSFNAEFEKHSFRLSLPQQLLSCKHRLSRTVSVVYTNCLGKMRVCAIGFKSETSTNHRTSTCHFNAFRLFHPPHIAIVYCDGDRAIL